MGSDICIDCNGAGKYPSGAVCKSCEGTGFVDEGEGLGARFNVVQFFVDDSSEYVRRSVGPREAVEAAHHYTHNVAVKLGITRKVIITDMLDRTVFEWRHGEGVVFPPASNPVQNGIMES